MIRHFKKNQWSPYTVGSFIGLTFLLSYIFFNKTLGSSVSFVKIAAWIHNFFDTKAVCNTPYYQDYLKSNAWIDWQVSLVIGVFVGAFISLKLSKAYCDHHSRPVSKRSKMLSFIGGVLVILGARFAGGCTSGHAITGGIQLAVSGYLFMIGVFMLGIPTAFIARKLFKKDYL